jgi:hypothetical protein
VKAFRTDALKGGRVCPIAGRAVFRAASPQRSRTVHPSQAGVSDVNAAEVVFWTAAALPFYAYVVYPALIWTLSRLWPAA